MRRCHLFFLFSLLLLCRFTRSSNSWALRIRNFGQSWMIFPMFNSSLSWNSHSITYRSVREDSFLEWRSSFRWSLSGVQKLQSPYWMISLSIIQSSGSRQLLLWITITFTCVSPFLGPFRFSVFSLVRGVLIIVFPCEGERKRRKSRK